MIKGKSTFNIANNIVFKMTVTLIMLLSITISVMTFTSRSHTDINQFKSSLQRQNNLDIDENNQGFRIRQDKVIQRSENNPKQTGDNKMSSQGLLVVIGLLLITLIGLKEMIVEEK